MFDTGDAWDAYYAGITGDATYDSSEYEIERAYDEAKLAVTNYDRKDTSMRIGETVRHIGSGNVGTVIETAPQESVLVEWDYEGHPRLWYGERELTQHAR